jgi:hypothetical protein
VSGRSWWSDYWDRLCEEDRRFEDEIREAARRDRAADDGQGPREEAS